VQGANAHLGHHFGHAVGHSDDVVGVDLGVVKWRLQLVLSPQRTHCLIDEIRTDGISTEPKQSTEVMHLPRQTHRLTDILMHSVDKDITQVHAGIACNVLVNDDGVSRRNVV